MNFVVVLSLYSGIVTVVVAVDGVMHGNPLVPGRTLTASTRSFILTHKPLPAGHVDYFSLTSSGVNRKLYLQIWRPLVDEQYRLLGQLFYRTDNNGTVQVSVSNMAASLVTQRGDLLGFTSVDKEVGVTYTLSPFDEGALLRTMVVDEFPVPGNAYKFGGSFFDKKFAISVHITQGLPRTSLCDEGNAGCDHLCTMVKARPVCTCLPGFTLLEDAYTCSDVDECEESPPVCSQGMTCINLAGSYNCIPLSSNVSRDVHIRATPVRTLDNGMARGFTALQTDPLMLTVCIWLLVLTLLSIATIVTVCISRKQGVQFIYGSNMHHLRNPKTLSGSLDQVSVDKDSNP